MSTYLSAYLIKVLAQNEVRLRLRRSSTMFALLAVIAASWAMIADQAGGSSLLVIEKARVLYTSSALALGSSTLAGLLFGLGGFYLVRGRMAEDIRSGTGSVIGATPVPNGLFLLGRWLGGVAYLSALVLCFMLTILALHGVRGHGPIELLVYLQTYLLLLLPMILFVTSCAVLFDSYAPLMGKGGDVLFFFVWIAQVSLMTQFDETTAQTPLSMVFDFSGLGVGVMVINNAFNVSSLHVGASPFDPALPALTLPAWLWTRELVLLRLCAGVLALLPLLPALLLFHRFSPDRVKRASARTRRSPLAIVNGWLRPLARLTRPVFALAARLPGLPGQVMADVALTLASAPFAILAIAAAAGAALLLPYAQLGPLLIGVTAYWGILISDLSTRDYQSAAEDMTGSVRGGTVQRYVRQFAATAVLGLLLTGLIGVRWLGDDPVRALALASGLFALSAAASLFGRCSRSGRLFLSLFLFGLYVAVNVNIVPRLDAVGFNGVANVASASLYLVLGALMLAGGYLWNRRAI